MTSQSCRWYALLVPIRSAASCTAGLACLLVLGCSKSPGGLEGGATNAPAEQPVSNGGSTDAAYDWEHPNGLGPRLNVIPVDFRSSKTLQQTTDWLRWALERYGHVHPTVYWEDILDVKASGCALEWSYRYLPDEQSEVTKLRRYSLSLSDVTLGRGDLWEQSDVVNVSVKNDGISIVTRYFEHGKEKPANPNPENAGHVRFGVKREDRISERIAFAFIHAARLCGAQPPAAR